MSPRQRLGVAALVLLVFNGSHLFASLQSVFDPACRLPTGASSSRA